MSSLYIHIPFREGPCAYSDEYYVVDEGPFDTFMHALFAEMDHYGARYTENESTDTIYVGGGSPSLLSPQELGGILERARSTFRIASDHEITIEVNPHDLSRRYLQELRTAGFDRLSVAVESFFSDDLEWLGCPYSPEDAKAALLLIPQAGFANYSIDLLCGVPNRPLEYWQANLERAARHEIPHIAVYRAGQSLQQNDGDGSSTAEVEEYRFAVNYLRKQGYVQYELSHFARPGFASRHLRSYWSHDNYIGLGPSAHSFWWTRGARAYRWHNTPNVAKYRDLLMQRELPLEARERLTPMNLANEYIMLRLQTRDGLDLETLKNRYAADLSRVKREELKALEDEGLIERPTPKRLRLTDEGKLRHDAITSRLLVRKLHLTTP